MLRLILGQGLTLVIVGILVGLGVSIVMGRVLSRFLPLVDAADWITFAGVAAGLAALALLACYLPARRATMGFFSRPTSTSTCGLLSRFRYQSGCCDIPPFEATIT